MTQDELKKAAAHAALDYIADGSIVGVGTGSTVNHFIDALAGMRDRIRRRGLQLRGQLAPARRARHRGVRSQRHRVPARVCRRCRRNRWRLRDDQGRRRRADARKIVAAVSERFICICDASKRVDVLGRFPLPVEVIPMACSHVMRELRRLGGEPRVREGFVTDNGNLILDVHDLQISDPVATETRINQIVGVVTNGLFAERGADVLLLAGAGGVERLQAR
jgi:ribose-5-phosphate isomerase (EC 5.3.1.6)